MESTICVTVAAYRDPELLATLRDAVEKAAVANRLHFSICLQENAEQLPEIELAVTEALAQSEASCSVLSIDAERSKGCCWARAKLHTLEQRCTYVLQLDSHHRFAQDWDCKLLDCLQQCPSAKPILSAYLPPYAPEDSHLPQKPCRIVCLGFTDAETVAFAPRYIDWQLDRPLPSAMLSAHFIFAPREFFAQVPYDKRLYFSGEEDTLSLRAFTHGWDVFAPQLPVAWHYYSRERRAKHWDDHDAWWRRNEVALGRVRSLLLGDDLGAPYGYGSERTLSEYRSFAGIQHNCRKLSVWAKHGFPESLVSEELPRDKQVTHWIHDEGAFRRHPRHPDTWVELKLEQGAEQPVAIFAQLSDENLLLYDASRDLQLRFRAGVCEFKVGQADWQVLFEGLWVLAQAPHKSWQPPRQKPEPQTTELD